MLLLRRRAFALVTNAAQTHLDKPAVLSSTRSPAVCCSLAAVPPSASASSSSGPDSDDDTSDMVRVRIRATDGTVYERLYDDGANLMEAIRDDGTLPVEVPGACNGMCKCSTCHVLLRTPEWVAKAEKVAPVSDMEQDCLDKAPGVTDASRLSCQLTLCGELDGMEIDLPTSTVDVRWQAALRRPAKK